MALAGKILDEITRGAQTGKVFRRVDGDDAGVDLSSEVDAGMAVGHLKDAELEFVEAFLADGEVIEDEEELTRGRVANVG